MSDPLRTETSRTHDSASRAERDAKIEQLLLAGLDHYFAQQFDQAINVWTRALFLDRSHARARAYIERARSAQAERQRESEALLHDGTNAARRGDRSEARRLLDAAMAHGGPTDELLALLDRVERLEHNAEPADLASVELEEPRLALDVAEAGVQRRRVWYAFAALAVIIVAGAVLAASLMRAEWEPLVERSLARRLERTAPAAPVSARVPATLPPPRRSAGTLARARALVSGGKLRDALPLLESIRPTDPERADAERLRADVQRQLIALGPLPVALVPRATDGVLP